MKDLADKCRVAAVQASPVVLDKNQTIDKAVDLIMEAGKNGADIIVFPECFIPCYPRGFSYGYIVGSRTMEGREDWKRYYDNSVIVPSEDTDVIAQAAKEAGAYVVMGMTERDAVNCTLYCTVAFFGPDGSYLGKHRKMKPTGSERLIWGEGDVDTLIAVDTPWGPMGSLICWENYMPLARVALYEKGISLYIAPTADNREDWQTTMKHIALESRTFVVSCNMYATKDMYPQDLNYIHELENLPDRFCPGGTCVIDPFGKYVAEPLWDQEGIVYADLNMNKVPLSRMDFDPTGHYSRPDSLELVIHDRSK